MKETKWPTVSFIVCTYNCRDYTKRCFDSIKNQDYPGKIEMIAVDSYSTDGTIEILKKLKDKIINRYLSLIGTDPFVDYKSIDSLLSLGKLKLIDRGDYWTYHITPDDFIITGGYYFAIKRDTLKKIGGYTQDTDVVY